MGTPADRLRKKAEEARQEQEVREREQNLLRIEREQSLRTRESRVHSLAQMVLNRTENLVRATGTNIHVWLSYEQGRADPGFRISIGHKYWVMGLLRESGWGVIVNGLDGLQSEVSYANDNNFDQSWDAIVEPLIEKSVQAVIRGEESPY